MDLKEYIINKSKKLGIDIIGFTKTEKLNDMAKFLRDREEKGYDTEFEEKDVVLRTNPLILMPDSRTIIAIGLSYNVEYKMISSKDIKWQGVLSKSSWGEDYHKVLRSKMEMLVKEISKVVDFKYTVCVDTSPLIDRQIAMRAGIGWYGKNCSIINDDFGSFIFLGYILTDLELEEDNRVEEKCGDCRLCIDACPGGAIEEGYIINTKRCISYLTQTKDRVPYDLREKMGVKIYGCDTCQQVCPKNQNIQKGNSEEFIPKTTNGVVNIEEIMTISNKEFKGKYGTMSGAWRGKNVLKRNAIIALANIGDKSCMELLKDALNDESPMIREYAAWAIIKIDEERGIELVQERILKEKDIDIAEEMKRLIELQRNSNQKILVKKKT
ncbi:putative iron-sulfur cluster-binding protein [Proteiniborus sp. DW1]|uniref:tRNA epoxyqueuosine(34) reductase QueG n=1 Tax=Proteiniborus sp. DW1 TaxID=1889883 RepID=UPI00092DF928|nr:tRNA epoxyqueuosine(34) reductase QueG [Proteiniborus sp. DW1]SCG82967.1 putative iron-sulfur cluster-binding protein [Proteiniborus sp. DW1]